MAVRALGLGGVDHPARTLGVRVGMVLWCQDGQMVLTNTERADAGVRVVYVTTTRDHDSGEL